MEASISKTLKTYWVLWHPLKPSVWGECSACLTLILFPHVNTFPSLSAHRLSSGNWPLADAVWKEVTYVTSTGSGVGPPRAALQALSPICQVNGEDTKEPEKVRPKEPGSLNHRWEQRHLQACDQEPHTGTLQDPGQSSRCAPPPASWAVRHTAGWVYLTPCTPGPRMKKYSRQFFSRLQSPFLPACIFLSTLWSPAAGVFSNK